MKIIQTDSEQGHDRLEGYPNNCPFCHKTITPTFLYGHEKFSTLEVLTVCPSHDCKRSFISYYELVQNQYFQFSGVTTIGNPIGKEFNNVIQTISENFVNIYNQAYSADQQNLNEICGVGYRKALEFLIKDYIISNKPADKEKVEKMPLAACIAEYIDDSRIKSVAKRAVWLGNDETHYVRKWDGKNLNDLKKLIDLTIHWIEMEVLTKSFEHEMPD
jgi:hypothetical protein